MFLRRYKWYDRTKFQREVREKNEDHRDWTKWVGKIDPRKEDQRNHRLSATAARPFMAYNRLQYSGKKWFLQEQQSFMVSNPSWIVEGNYTSTLEERIKEADKIIWLKVPRYLAIYRVVWRSKKKDKQKSRPDMPESFSEKLNREYLEFLSFIWHFEENNEPKIQQLIQVANARNKLIILKTRREKQEFLTKLKIESKNN